MYIIKPIIREAERKGKAIEGDCSYTNTLLGLFPAPFSLRHKPAAKTL